MKKILELMAQGHLEQAKALCAQALTADSTDVSVARVMAQIYARQGDADGLINALERVYSLDATDAGNLYSLAAVFRDCGRFTEARDAYISALQLQPGRADVYHNLVLITRYSEHNEEVATIEALYKKTASDTKERRQLAFALGKVFDDLGEYEKAFAYFREGNGIVEREANHSIENDIRGFRLVHATFDAAFFRRYRNIGCADRRPIFVLGLPRSGTSLVEQILASHPNVHGGGELLNFHNIVMGLGPIAGSPFPTGFDRIGKSILRGRAQAYLRELKAIGGGKAHVTNKAITNVVYLGLIRVMLPNATIIDCRRDPRDQGLSLFQKDIPEQQYGYDLERIGNMSCLYSELLEHWEQFMPGKIFRIQYEELVAEPEPHIRRMLDHCRLKFDEACLSFHKTERIVRTMSRTQVRQPVYQSAVGRWKNYEKNLGPLISALERDPAEPN